MSCLEDSSAEAVLCLRVQPSWAAVDDIRHVVESFCASACPDAAREGQLALATHELVQNAISNADARDIELRLEVDRSAERVSVAVTNHALPERIAVLRERVGRTQAYANPLLGYVEAMREDPHSPGGIGLARVRFEAALDLDLAVEGETVTVRAAGPLVAPDPASLRA